MGLLQTALVPRWESKDTFISGVACAALCLPALTTAAFLAGAATIADLLYAVPTEA